MLGRAGLADQLAAHAAVVAAVEKAETGVAKLATAGRVVGLPGWLAWQQLLNKTARCQTDCVFVVLAGLAVLAVLAVLVVLVVSVDQLYQHGL